MCVYWVGVHLLHCLHYNFQVNYFIYLLYINFWNFFYYEESVKLVRMT